MKNIIKPNCFYDSILLMQIADILSKQNSCEITLMMGTDANKSLLRERNLLTSEGEKAKVNDLIICCEQNIDEKKLFETIDSLSQTKTFTEKTIVDKDITDLPLDTNLICISIPGEFVFYEVKKIIETFNPIGEKVLGHKLCIFIFSDNVTIEEEKQLKNLAKKKNVLIMGPDCGTAIINGVGIGFSNKVKTIFVNSKNKDAIGIISAGGTGLQAISSMIHNFGFTISQAIGTGGRDLSETIGGITTLESIKYLENDINTKTVIIFSKPPSAKVVKKIVSYINKHCKKKYILNFLGSKNFKDTKKVFFASTMQEAVLKSIKFVNPKFKLKPVKNSKNISNIIKNLQKTNRKYLRGLYSGGSLCDESMIVLKKYIGNIYSNTPIDKEYNLTNPWESFRHTVVDLGEDIFTRGKPHPMIDFTFRKERMLQESKDKEVAVIMFDIVLGWGANKNPVEELEQTIIKSKKLSLNEILFCSVIVGTDEDVQNYSYVEKKLKKLGVITFNSNVEMSEFVGKILNKL
jgi:succinyl-CoA synthetase alpha subunit